MRRALKLLPIAVVLTAQLACGAGETAATCPAPPPEGLVGSPLATVDGAKVGTAGWEQAASRKVPADGKTWSAEEKSKILGELIDEELLFREAFDRGLYQDPKVRKILVNLLLRAEIYEKIKNEDFADADLRAFFDGHKEDFVVPEKIQLKRIFVGITDTRPDADAKKLADELYAKVKAAPDSFREVAMASSEDPFGRRGGDIGYLDAAGKPGVPPEVVERAFQLESGAISEPFLAAGGYNIVYVPTKRERIERSFDQMRGAVLRRMKNEKYEELTEAFIDGLEKQASISIDQAALDGWNPPPPSRPGLRLGAPEGTPEIGIAPTIPAAPGVPGEAEGEPAPASPPVPEDDGE